MSDVPDWAVWTTIVGVAAVTFGIRFSFIYLLGRLEGVPNRLERALSFVPASVLAALSVPAFFAAGSTQGLSFVDARFVAGVVATAVAWRTEDITATIVAGMATLWVTRILL